MNYRNAVNWNSLVELSRTTGLGEGNEAYNLKVTRYTYVEETDNDANKDSSLIGSAFP